MHKSHIFGQPDDCIKTQNTTIKLITITIIY